MEVALSLIILPYHVVDAGPFLCKPYRTRQGADLLMLSSPTTYLVAEVA